MARLARCVALAILAFGVPAWASAIGAGSGLPAHTTTAADGRTVLRVVIDGSPSTQTRFAAPGSHTTASTSREDIWAGSTAARPLPGAAGVSVEIVSLSTSDGPGGTGVRTVHVTWLGTTGVSTTTTVTLNGTTAVAMTGTVWRINVFHAVTVGSGGVAAGDISVRDATDHTTIYERIPLGSASSTTAARTVPAGQYWYVSSAHYSAASGKDCTIRLRATVDPETFAPNAGVFAQFDVTDLQNDSTERLFYPPLRIPPLSDVKMDVVSASAGALTSAMIEGWTDTQ